MKFSTKAEYGLRAIVRVAKSGQKPCSLAKIARQEGISLNYLEKLMAKLKKARLVKSAKGMRGGYFLARAVDKIKVKEIISALEGTLAPFYCVSVQGKKNTCPRSCLTQRVWVKLYKEIIKTLNHISLADLIK